MSSARQPEETELEYLARIAILAQENFQRTMNEHLDDRIVAVGGISKFTPLKEVKVHKVKRKTGKLTKSSVSRRKIRQKIAEALREGEQE
jgi:hypothetical protein